MRAAAYKNPCVLKYPNLDASREFKRIAAQISGVEDKNTVGGKKAESFIDQLARYSCDPS